MLRVDFVAPSDAGQAPLPEAHLLAVDQQGAARASASLWWDAVPPMSGERLGIIGHYSAEDDAAAAAVLTRACAELADRGCSLAVGPMDRDTWHKYRLVTEPGDEPPFFLEPANPPSHPEQWRCAGFEAFAHYSSALDVDLAHVDPRAERVEARLAEAGVAVRELDDTAFEADLSAIFEVSLASFADNLLYTPITLAEFLSLYRPLRDIVIPQLVLIAEQSGRPVGFAFALPDLAQKMRGEAIETAIIKTVAILPGRQFAGLGLLLAERVRAAARGLGFRRAVNALMYDSNDSRNLSSHYARPMRGYTLFARRLTP